MTILSQTPATCSRPSRQRPSLFDMIAVWRQRRQLARLDDAALDDIGLTRDQALAEARRPVWNVPEHWLK